MGSEMKYEGYYRSNKTGVLFKSDFFSYSFGIQYKLTPINLDNDSVIVNYKDMLKWITRGRIYRVSNEEILKPIKQIPKFNVLGVPKDLVEQLDLI